MNNSIFTFRRSDEFAASLDFDDGTAFDCSSNGESLILADCREYLRINIEHETVERKRRPNHKIVRSIKCHPKNPNNFAAMVSKQILHSLCQY